MDCMSRLMSRYEFFSRLIIGFCIPASIAVSFFFPGWGQTIGSLLLCTQVIFILSLWVLGFPYIPDHNEPGPLDYFLLLCLLLVTAFLFFPALNNTFMGDDIIFLARARSLGESFWFWVRGNGQNFRPLWGIFLCKQRFLLRNEPLFR